MRNLLALTAVVILVGCSSTPPGGLPAGSALVAENQPMLGFTAPDKGTIFLLDPSARQIVYETAVEQGQRVDIDAKTSRATVNGRTAAIANTLRPDGTYQLFFKASGKREYHPMYNP